MGKTFDELSLELSENAKSNLSEMKSKNDGKTFAIFGLTGSVGILTILFGFISVGFVIVTVSLVALFALAEISKQSYSKEYKRVVINQMVKTYDKNLTYMPTNGLTRAEYSAGFKENQVDKLVSEDKISGYLYGKYRIEISEITTYINEKVTDSYGNVKNIETQTFKGLFGYLILNGTPKFDFTIVPKSMFNNFAKEKIEIDSAEFEKHLTLFSDNRLKTAQVFTSDVVTKFVDMLSINNSKLDVRLIGNRLYFKYNCGDIFEAPIFSDGLDEKHLRDAYKLIYYPLEMLATTAESVEKVMNIENIVN